MYFTVQNSNCIRRDDGTIIPNDPANTDFAEYLSWVAAGNSPLPAPSQTIPLKQQAQTALDKVTGPSGTIMRCVAAGVAVPAVWSAYVLALRLIANGSDTTSTTLPTQPNYPAGT